MSLEQFFAPVCPVFRLFAKFSEYGWPIWVHAQFAAFVLTVLVVETDFTTAPLSTVLTLAEMLRTPEGID